MPSLNLLTHFPYYRFFNGVRRFNFCHTALIKLSITPSNSCGKNTRLLSSFAFHPQAKQLTLRLNCSINPYKVVYRLFSSFCHFS